MVETIEKWLLKYGPRKALVFGRFIPFARTLINPVCGVAHLDRKLFSTWNAIGAIIWTQSTIGVSYLLGDAIEGSINMYLYPLIGIIVLITIIPLLNGVYKETTIAPACFNASTAVKTDPPVVEVSSTAKTFFPLTSGPSIRRCNP